jgi:hypothetical protein
MDLDDGRRVIWLLLQGGQHLHDGADSAKGLRSGRRHRTLASPLGQGVAQAGRHHLPLLRPRLEAGVGCLARLLRPRLPRTLLRRRQAA